MNFTLINCNSHIAFKTELWAANIMVYWIIETLIGVNISVGR